MLDKSRRLSEVNFGMSTLDSPASLQVPEELSAFIELLRAENVSSYLEIGVRYGGTFDAVVRGLANPKFAVAVDFPGGDFGDDQSVGHLLAVCGRLREFVPVVTPIFGPSSAPEVVERASKYAPFDAILIDGDHAYEAVKRDFELYAPLGRLIVLHDIAAPPGTLSRRGCLLEVERLWRELRGNGHRTQEIVASGSIMGFGIIFS